MDTIMQLCSQPSFLFKILFVLFYHEDKRDGSSFNVYIYWYLGEISILILTWKFNISFRSEFNDLFIRAMLVFIVAIYLLNDIWYKTRCEIRFNYLYRKLCSIDVNKSWRDRFSFFFLFFFEASNRSIALKRQTREERSGSWTYRRASCRAIIVL